MNVNQIDIHKIEERLMFSKNPDDKETWHYIKKLKEAIERQKQLTANAISKLRKPE